MIGYVTLGTNDVAKAAAFYDELLAVMGATRMMEGDTFVAWTTGPDKPGISVTKPYDGNAASVGNGTMVALMVDSEGVVNDLHAKALALGGADEGAPGERMRGFYAAYFRDLDGNKLAVFKAGGYED